MNIIHLFIGHVLCKSITFDPNKAEEDKFGRLISQIAIYGRLYYYTEYPLPNYRPQAIDQCDTLSELNIVVNDFYESTLCITAPQRKVSYHE